MHPNIVILSVVHISRNKRRNGSIADPNDNQFIINSMHFWRCIFLVKGRR